MGARGTTSSRTARSGPSALIWLGRVVLAAVVAGLVVVPPPSPVSVAPLGALRYAGALAALGGLLATFARTRRLGGLGVVVGVWALFTGYAVVAFVDPLEVRLDSLGSNRGPTLDTDLGARAWGAFMFVIGQAVGGIGVLALREGRRPHRGRRGGRR